MTNGEMIQKVFNCEACEPIFEDDIIHVIFADKKDSAIGFDWSWWNMEHKEPTDKIFTKADLDSMAKAINYGWKLRVNEVLEKIIAEIAQVCAYSINYPNWEYAKGLQKAIEIIDKYKAEVEPQESE